MTSYTEVLSKLKEDILLRGLSNRTDESYSAYAKTFLEYCGKPIEQIDELDIREFLKHLITEKKLTPATVNIYSAAIRFLFAVTLNRTLNYLQIPRLKEPQTYPTLLSREEIASIIQKCTNIKYQAIFMLAYGSGLRVSEIAKLKIKHIDSKDMRILVENGKGAKSRYTILSQNCLSTLRDYWRKYQPNHPAGWIFPGKYNTEHISIHTIESAFGEAIRRADIKKDVKFHSFRHAFATHLLEDGVDLLRIKDFLGHTCLQSTTVYLHLANFSAEIKSPIDNLPAYSGVKGERPNA